MAEFGRIEVRGSEEWESEELGILNVCTVTQRGEERVGEQSRVFSVEQAARGKGDGKIRLVIEEEKELAGS